MIKHGHDGVHVHHGCYGCMLRHPSVVMECAFTCSVLGPFRGSQCLCQGLNFHFKVLLTGRKFFVHNSGLKFFKVLLTGTKFSVHNGGLVLKWWTMVTWAWTMVSMPGTLFLLRALVAVTRLQYLRHNPLMLIIRFPLLILTMKTYADKWSFI